MPKSLLSRDELDYIQQTLANNIANHSLPAPSFRVDGGNLGNALLAELGKQAELSLEARFGDQRLSFPLHLVEDEFHALHLEMGAPGIFQQGQVQRQWRLKLEQPLTLLQENGQPSDLRVYEISPSGVLIDSHEHMAPPRQFKLWLPLPEQDPIALHGRRVRRTPSHLTAFRLDLLPPRNSERLRQFIFQQHRLYHPELAQQSA